MSGILTASETVYALYVGIALGVFLLFTGLTQILSRREHTDAARNRRMRMIAAGATTEERLAVLKPDLGKGPLTRLPIVGDLPRLMRRAGVNVAPGRFLMMCALIAITVLATVTVSVGPVPGVVAGIISGFILPFFVLNRKALQRAEKMTTQLPEALELLARGLRVGHPLNPSIQAVSVDIADPIGSEFGIMFDQISYGDDIVDAFRDFAERVELEDVNYLAASIGIQHGTGGDLARIVQVLSQVVRGRIALRRRIQAISAEGRLSGNFLSLLPVFIFLSTSFISPEYYSGIMDDPLFKPIAGAVVLFTILNYLAIRKLVNFRI